MDSTLIELQDIDAAIENGMEAFKKFMKAFVIAGATLEEIKKNADGPEDCARATEALDEIKKILG